jgi:uncharacterized membrane protein (GlpM family)
MEMKGREPTARTWWRLGGIVLFAAMITVGATAPGAHASPGFAPADDFGPNTATLTVTPTQTANGEVTVNWSAGPAGTVSYTVSTNPQPGSPTGSCVSSTPTSGLIGCTLTGLTPGVAYVITVNARSATPATLATGTANFTVGPNAPTGATAAGSAAAPTSIVATWDAPSSIPATATWTYSAIANPGGRHCEQTDLTATLTATCTITGLTPGLPYFVVVTLHVVDTANTPQNGGTSAYSAPSNVALVAMQATPTTVTATPASATSATVSWTAGGSSALSTAYYTATAKQNGYLCNTANASTTSCTVTGLVPGVPYTFSVIAHGDTVSTVDSVSSTYSPAVFMAGSSVSLMADTNGKYVTAENAGAAALIANRDAVGPWEEFDLSTA